MNLIHVFPFTTQNTPISQINCVEISMSNIINESCIIGNNQGKNVFHKGSSSSQIKITNCTLDSDIMTNTRYTGSITIISSNEYNFINALSHFATNKCDSIFETRRYNKRKNDVFLTFLQYLFMISLLPPPFT